MLIEDGKLPLPTRQRLSVVVALATGLLLLLPTGQNVLGLAPMERFRQLEQPFLGSFFFFLQK